MKAIECKMILNTASGRCTEPQDFPSISKAIDYARDSSYFAYRIYDKKNNKLVASGLC